MKRLLYYSKHIIFHPLISNTSVLFIGSFFTNIINVVFTLFISRNLSLSEWGVFSRVVSLSSLPLYFATAIAPTVVNYAAGYYAKNELGKAKSLYYKASKLCIAVGISFFILLLLFSKEIGEFFKLNTFFYIFIVGLIVLFSYGGAVNDAFLKAKLSFKFLSIMTFLSSVIKLITGVLLVLLGFHVIGAVSGYLFSIFFVFIISFIPIRNLFSRYTSKVKIRTFDMLKYGWAAGISIIGLSSFISTDILLAGHFFSKNEAGLYSGLSLLGRTIFFLTGPISAVLFPMVVQRIEKKMPHQRLLLLAFLLVLFPSVFFAILYSLFPNFFIVLLLKQESYLRMSPFLGYFSAYIALYSIVYLFVNYLLSIKKTKIFIFISLTSIMQIIGFFLFHNGFFEYISVSFSAVLVLGLALLVYYLKTYEKK